MDPEAIARIKAKRAAKLAADNSGLDSVKDPTSHQPISSTVPIVDIPAIPATTAEESISSSVSQSSSGITAVAKSTSSELISEPAVLGPAGEAQLRRSMFGEESPRRSFRRDDADSYKGYMEMDDIVSSSTDVPINETNRG